MKTLKQIVVAVFVASLLGGAVGGYIAAVVGGKSQSLLGAEGTRFPHGISADSTSPADGELRGSTLTITGVATFAAAPIFSSSCSTQNNLTTCVSSGSFTDATTTAFYANPVSSATSTCSVVVHQTGISTTTIAWAVGTSTLTSIHNSNGLDSFRLASTTVATSTGPLYFESGMDAKDIDMVDNLGFDSVYSIVKAPEESIVGFVANSAASNVLTGGVTGNSNTFDGTYRVVCKY